MGLPENSNLNLFSKWKKGKTNLITDVPGVKVGSVTLKNNEINTGVTAILPHGGNLFQDKVMAATSIINGFGKSVGLIQIEEMGTIETPIIMTNTLSIGTAVTALTKYMLKQNEDIGITTGTVNCLVTECNDGRLNDIRGMHIKEQHIEEAIQKADKKVDEGAVGAGTGMCCLGVKGGIGSASRCINVDGNDFVVGALVMSNFGAAGNLVIGGNHIGKSVESMKSKEKDQGSIIMIIATDVPLNERQLKRVAKRATISLGRTGSYIGNGSGDVAIAFTTANRVPQYSEKNLLNMTMFFDENIDMVFEAAVETVEEAIISSLYHADTTIGVRGNEVLGLREYMSSIKEYSYV